MLVKTCLVSWQFFFCLLWQGCIYVAAPLLILQGQSEVLLKNILLCWGLMAGKPLRVILCGLPEKGRKVIEVIVEEMKEKNRKKLGNERK